MTSTRKSILKTLSIIISGLFIFLTFYSHQSLAEIKTSINTPPRQFNLAAVYISTIPTQFYTLDDKLYIGGHSVKNASITVALTKKDSQSLVFKVKSDKSGDWQISEKVFLERGDWTVKACEITDSTSSNCSDPMIIKSIVTGINLLGLQISYATITIITLILFVFLGVIILYFLKKIKKHKLSLKNQNKAN